MGISRRIATVAVAVGMAATALVGSSGPASAGPVPGPTSPNTPGAHSWTTTIATANGTRSTAVVAWNNTTFGLSMRATTGQLGSNYCVTVFLDWRADGHHDARAVRNCRANTAYTYSFRDNNTDNLLGGPKKVGVCYGINNAVGTCNYWSIDGTQNVVMNWTPWPNPNFTHACVLSFSRQSAAGVVGTFVDPHSQRNNLQSDGGC